MSSRSHRRSHRSYRSYHHEPETHGRIQQAAAAAFTAGAVEAIKVRKEPGPWTGEKGVRVVTAAAAAAALDAIVDKNPSEKTKRHVAESTVGGLIANHFLNGSRKQRR